VTTFAANSVTYKIKTAPHPVEFGQSLGVVSNANAWETSSASPLQWTDGDVWEGDVEVPADLGTFEFKFVVLAGGEVIQWEDGGNKICDVKKKGKTLECSWGTAELKEVEEKTATRKRSSSPKKKKVEPVPAAEDVAIEEPTPVVEPVSANVQEPVVQEPVVQEPVVQEPVVQEMAEEQPVVEEMVTVQDNVAQASPVIEGDMVTYTFDEGDHDESAADIAKRMYGQ
jgi:hypothetical protein